MSDTRQIIPLDRGWRFCKGEIKRWETVPHMLCYDMTKAGYELGDAGIIREENPWRPVELPHDWNTEEPSDPEAPLCSNGYKHRGVGWYALEFDMPPFADDQSALLEFEGVMGDCLVYVNGARALRNHSGYNGFYQDVTACLVPGARNSIAVRVDNTAWEGWWYEGAGIYRPVRLILRNRLHFEHLSPFARPVLREDGWHVALSATVENSAEADLACRVRARLLDAAGGVVAEAELGEAAVPALGRAALGGDLFAGQPRLWDIDDPALYQVEFALSEADGTASDSIRVRCGFRTVEWTADRGMLLNGRTVPVHGICCHQDHAGVGIAVSRSILRYRVRRLKEMGCNAYRCAHHMPWEALLEICDELGMLVMDENRHFNTLPETLEQLDDLVLRARNHPSVFLYCLFNEEYWQAERRGYLIARTLARRVKALDDSRAVTAAMNGGVLTEKNASDVTDVAGMNYFIRDYAGFAARCPGKPLLGTENGPIYCTRGEVENDEARQVFDGYGDTTSPYGEQMDETMDAVAGNAHVAGLFMWGGFDYRGEPQPYEWPSVFSHWGFADMCGFRKDSSYLLESWYSDAPVIHITPHWNLKPGEAVRVCVFTNAERVELRLNGRSLGERTVSHRRAEWRVEFEPGTLEAVGRMADGREISACARTAGAAAAIQAEVFREAGDPMAIVDVALVDGDGLLAVNDSREIRIGVENGAVAGIGNGDPNASSLPDIGDAVPAFHGRCQVIVRREGAATLRLSAEGLPDCVMSL